jgi:glycogen operon protein
MIPARTPAQEVPCGMGQPWPLGASLVSQQGAAGVNFAVYAEDAERVEICLFDEQGQEETARFALPARTGGVWHGFAPGLVCGQLYGLRAHGPYEPEHGRRFNPAKLLIDPFARALAGGTALLSLERDYQSLPAPNAQVLHARPDPENNAARVPKARVLDWAQELQAGAAVAPRPQVPPARAVLYEAHVKGLTCQNPAVPPAWQGCFAGVASPAMLAHYQRLGITTLCLLPVQLHITESHLLHKDLRNYWGYNTLGYFIPMPAYASGEFANERAEFRWMVDQLHQQGLEVVLDVVYNHSAESDTFGPTLSWRGLGSAGWYARDGDGQHLNFSGCGNSFNMGKAGVVQLVMDSLRWWVQAFGVDGFRFDLATSLGRDPALGQRFNPRSALLAAMAQDPVLAGIKLIAEPWDVGPEGYQLGHFPAPWQEWNDRFRDTSRAFWLGFSGTRGDMARRLTGSNDRFQPSGRGPLASVNLITAHDGMTLADLTAYRDKHNTANGEGNRDGHNHNLSANAGEEGPSSDATVLALRGEWRRALLATLFCAQGTPQLLAGDELGHSQHGNNNAYCQDNETSWLNWTNVDAELTAFVAQLIHLRHAHAALHHARWFAGAGALDAGAPADIHWRRPDGLALSAADWDDTQSRSFACLVEVHEGAHAGQAPVERWLLAFHPANEAVTFALPPGEWHWALNSAAAVALPQDCREITPRCRGTALVPPRCVAGWVQTLPTNDTGNKP